MLKGIPILRDLPVFRKIPGLRGLCNVRHIDFPQEDRNRLAASCGMDKNGQGKITFIVPNHPEFFTDWMIDKHIISIVAKKAACWAIHGVVNGLGRVAQKFWLANNLIAQIPGNTEPSRRHSVDWALKGHGVLLHPEGAVGWHSNHIGKLYPGAFDMAREAQAQASKLGQQREAYVAPVIWKLAFTKNVTKKLHKECDYVERKLKISGGEKFDQIQTRVFNIYETLLNRDIKKWGIQNVNDTPYRQRQLALIEGLSIKLNAEISEQQDPLNPQQILRAARRYARENKKAPNIKLVRDLINTITRHECLGEYAFTNPTISQEEVAEHIKRIRRDYCKGNLWDILNAYFPQAAGPRTAHVRVPEAFALHTKQDENAGVEELRARMQETLDVINAERRKMHSVIWFSNPFMS